MNRKNWLRQRGLQLFAPAADGYDPDAVTYWGASESGLTAGRKTLDSQLFTDLKAAGIFSRLDILYILAHEIEAVALRNAVKRSHDITKVGGVTFTADRGEQGDGTTGHLDTNYNPGTSAVHFSLNDACMFIYSRTQSAVSLVDYGAAGPSLVPRTYMAVRLATNLGFMNLNNGTLTSQANTDSTGLFMSNRIANNDLRWYRNGIQWGITQTTASTSVPFQNFYICAYNNNGVASSRCTRQYACVGAGGSLTGPQTTSLATIIETYLDTIGAGVA